MADDATSDCMSPKPSKPRTSKARKPAKKRGRQTTLMKPKDVAIAIELRSAGVSFMKIGEQLGFNDETVRRMVNRALKQAAQDELSDKATEQIVMTLNCIDHVIRSHWSNVADPKSAMVLMAAVKQRTELLNLAIYADKVVNPPLAPGETVIDARPVIHIHEASPPPGLAMKGQD
jgi:hypothetical protein